MNENIKPIFEIILPKLHSENIKYWVYGGIAYAAMVGKFYRKKSNPDVDLFVLENNFECLEEILENTSREMNWKICKIFIGSGRPKIELFINNVERLSVIPVYKADEHVQFKFLEGDKKYPMEVLTQVERHLGGYSFQTPQDSFLKTLLIDYLLSKNKYPKKRIEDARHILTEEEFQKILPGHNFER